MSQPARAVATCATDMSLDKLRAGALAGPQWRDRLAPKLEGKSINKSINDSESYDITMATRSQSPRRR
jgi:hypothetical protein